MESLCATCLAKIRTFGRFSNSGVERNGYRQIKTLFINAAHTVCGSVRTAFRPIEKKYDGNFSNELLTEYWAGITASIFAAVSFLEATINDLFADAAVEYCGYPKSPNSNTKVLMADMWKKGIPRTSRYRILEKFDTALILAWKPTSDAGKLPVQNVGLIVKIRNRLIHYEPEWMSNETMTSSMSATRRIRMDRVAITSAVRTPIGRNMGSHARRARHTYRGMRCAE